MATVSIIANPSSILWTKLFKRRSGRLKLKFVSTYVVLADVSTVHPVRKYSKSANAAVFKFKPAYKLGILILAFITSTSTADIDFVELSMIRFITDKSVDENSGIKGSFITESGAICLALRTIGKQPRA